jgi:beta-lactamase superfamily II metal-dependent hydrolase
VHTGAAVISTGEDNSYGHPNPEPFKQPAVAGARIRGRDRDGAMPILTGGKRLEISAFWRVRRKRREQTQGRRNHQINSNTASNSKKPIAASYS